MCDNVVYNMRLMLFFRSFKIRTSSNLVKKANSLPLAVGGEHWTISVDEDKYLYLVEGCRAKGYGVKNHFCKHMLRITYMSFGINEDVLKKLLVNN